MSLQSLIGVFRDKPDALECKNCEMKISELVKESYCSVKCYTEYVKPCVNCGESGGQSVDEDGPLLCGEGCHDQWNEKQLKEQEEKKERKLEGPELLHSLKRKAAPEPEDEKAPSDSPKRSKKQCSTCQKEITGPYAESKKTNQFYCSSACMPTRANNNNNTLRRSRRDRSSNSSDVLFDKLETLLNKSNLPAVQKNDLLVGYNTLSTPRERKAFIKSMEQK